MRSYESDYKYFSKLPETTYPNDYVYDTPYRENPSRIPTGSMIYPSAAVRHRNPQVLINPKPYDVEDRDTGYRYQIPQYPPYIYWYPNPVECRDTCGMKVCESYNRRMNDYKMCQFCQTLKTPQCWDRNTQKCTKCPRNKALGSCEDSFGSPNPNGWMQSNVAPINPKYTGCKNTAVKR